MFKHLKSGYSYTEFELARILSVSPFEIFNFLEDKRKRGEPLVCFQVFMQEYGRKVNVWRYSVNSDKYRECPTCRAHEFYFRFVNGINDKNGEECMGCGTKIVIPSLVK